MNPEEDDAEAPAEERDAIERGPHLGNDPSSWVRFGSSRAVARVAGHRHEIPLEEIRHVEAAATRGITVRWGISSARQVRHCTVGAPALTTVDLADEVETHLERHLPGHLFSIGDEEGIRYSRPWSLDEIEGHREAIRTVRSTGLSRRHGTAEVQTDARRWHVVRDHGFSAAPGDPPARQGSGRARLRGPAPALLLRDNQVILADGMVLGTIRHTENGGFTLALGSGNVLEALGRSRILLHDGQRIGTYRRKLLQLDRPLPEFLGIALLLGLLDAHYEQVEEPADESWITPWLIVPVTLFLLQLPKPFGPVIAACTLIAGLAWWQFRRPRRRELVGPPPEDLAQRRAEKVRQ